MTKSLIIGLGEVGTALKKVLEDAGYPAEGIDQDTEAKDKFPIVHICFPYSQYFLAEVRRYKDKYLEAGGFIIIHSTVPLGTSELIPAVHSPIRGTHPNLAEGIKTFKKYFGGERAEDAAIFFTPLVAGTAVTRDSRNTEALKLWDTTQYGWNIILEKGIHKFCEVNGLDFDFIYTEANQSYNEGYTRLKKNNVIRPVLKHMEGKIGGHCIIPNCTLLEHGIARTILRENQLL